MDDTSIDLTLQIKTSKEVRSVTISSSATVIELKARVAEAFSVSTEQLCLICQGKIMRDIEILSSYSSLFKNPHIGLVIKGASKKVINPVPAVIPTTVASATTTEPKQPPSSPSNQSTASSSSLPKLDEGHISMASQLMKNLPSDYLDMIIKQNPMIKKLCDENPELRSQMTGSNIKKMAEMLSNPTMAAELMRTQENMMQQIQNIPGAASHLERMLNSFPEAQPENPYAYDSSNNASSSRQDNVRPNLSGEPVPNPWEQQSRNSTQSSVDSSGGIPSPLGMDFSELANLFSNPNNPAGDNIFDGEQLDRAFQEAILASSSTKKIDNDQPTDTPSESIPSLPSNVNSLLSPNILADLLKPEVMKAFTEINKNVDVIKREAPHLIPSISRIISSQNSPFSPANLGNSAIDPLTSLAPASEQANQTPQASISEQIVSTEQLKERFKDQLDSLKDMGLNDEDLNIRALQIGGGNVQLALEWLFKNNFI